MAENLRRYLLYVTYLGKGFSGVQNQSKLGVDTVVGDLKKAIGILRPANDIKFTSSSRTDKNVHGLCNTLHIDLQPRLVNSHYDPTFVTDIMNTVLTEQTQSDPRKVLRVLKTQMVSEDFHSRFNARGRTYLYRLAHCIKTNEPSRIPWLPWETDRTFVLRNHPLDMDSVREAALLLSGTNEFRQFSVDKYLMPWNNTIKTVDVKIHPARACLHEHIPEIDEYFRFWEFEITGNSFLYRQVRRMMSVMVMVGQGFLSLDQVRELLNNKRPKDYRPVYVPGTALYLKQVHYLPEDLVQPDLGGSTPITELSQIYGEDALNLPISRAKEIDFLRLDDDDGPGDGDEEEAGDGDRGSHANQWKRS